MAGLEQKQKKGTSRESRQADHIFHSMRLGRWRKVEATLDGLCGERHRTLKQKPRKPGAEGVKTSGRAVKTNRISSELIMREEWIGRQIQYEKAREYD